MRKLVIFGLIIILVVVTLFVVGYLYKKSQLETEKKIPEKEELISMTNRTMLLFAQAVGGDDFSEFYESISKLWQSQIDKSALREAFRGFVEKGVDFTVIKDKNPIFSEEPFIDEDGLLTLTGYYPTEPYVIYFTLDYTFEYLNWRLFGIDVKPELPATTLLTYENLAYGIRIKYPQNWTKDEQPSEGIIVVFISPLESSSDEFPENLHVMVEDLSARPMTLSKYTEFNLNQLDQFFPDFTFLELDEVALARYPAHKIVFTATKDNYKMKSSQVWTIKNNKAYVLTYAAEVEKYSKFLETVEEMIDSFEIL